MSGGTRYYEMVTSSSSDVVPLDAGFQSARNLTTGIASGAGSAI